MTRFLVLAAALVIGSSLARSAGDPLPSITKAIERSQSRRPDIVMDMWLVVGTSGEFVLMRRTMDAGGRMCSMLPDDWYYGAH